MVMTSDHLIFIPGIISTMAQVDLRGWWYHSIQEWSWWGVPLARKLVEKSAIHVMS